MYNVCHHAMSNVEMVSLEAVKCGVLWRQYTDSLVEKVEVRRFLAVDIVPPVACLHLLMVKGSVGTPEAPFGSIGLAYVKYLDRIL